MPDGFGVAGLDGGGSGGSFECCFGVEERGLEGRRETGLEAGEEAVGDIDSCFDRDRDRDLVRNL